MPRRTDRIVAGPQAVRRLDTEIRRLWSAARAGEEPTGPLIGAWQTPSGRLFLASPLVVVAWDPGCPWVDAQKLLRAWPGKAFHHWGRDLDRLMGSNSTVVGTSVPWEQVRVHADIANVFVHGISIDARLWAAAGEVLGAGHVDLLTYPSRGAPGPSVRVVGPLLAALITGQDAG